VKLQENGRNMKLRQPPPFIQAVTNTYLWHCRARSYFSIVQWMQTSDVQLTKKGLQFERQKGQVEQSRLESRLYRARRL